MKFPKTQKMKKVAKQFCLDFTFSFILTDFFPIKNKFINKKQCHQTLKI